MLKDTNVLGAMDVKWDDSEPRRLDGTRDKDCKCC